MTPHASPAAAVPLSSPHSPLSPLPEWLSDRLSRCSNEARWLLLELRSRGATCAERAITDKRLKEIAGCSEREVIDLRGALLLAGCVVMSGASGNWFVPPGASDAELRAARDYARDLDDRAIAIHARAKHLRAACDLYDQQRMPVDSRGQGRLLFGSEPSAPTPAAHIGALVR